MHENTIFPNRYHQDSTVPDTEEVHAKIAAALVKNHPTMRVLLVSDITDECSSAREMNSPRIHAVGVLPKNEYIDPYSRQVNSNNTIWHGVYNKVTGDIRGAGNIPVQEDELPFTVAYSDILNYVYSIDTGAALPVYNLFAGHAFNCHPDHLRALKVVAANAYSPNAAIGRYLGGIDNIAAGVRNYAINYKKYEARRAAGEDIKFLDIPPISGDDPRTPDELFSLLTLFASTWCRANLVVEYLNNKLSAKNKEESAAVRNNLVLRWWIKSAPDRYTKDDLFQMASKNAFLRTFMREARIIDFSGKIINEEQATLSVETLEELFSAMIDLNNSIRGKMGRSGHHGVDVREIARKACIDIINAVE